MTSRHETIVAALMSALSAHGSQVIRERELPVHCPANGLINLLPADPEEQEEHLGTGVREWDRVLELEVVVQDHDTAQRIVKLDASLVEIGALLHGSTLGGLVDYLRLGAPLDADDIPMEGAASLKGAVVPVTLYYETSNNPMETQT
jgi:hypothetical protein